MNKKFAISGEKEPFLWALVRVIKGLGKNQKNTNTFYLNQGFDMEVTAKDYEETIVLLNTVGDTSAQVNKWIWRRLRFNDKKIGKEKAGLPVIVFGLDEKFQETPEGKVFRDFSMHHKYLSKPLSLYKFLIALDRVHPIQPHSLCVVRGDAPDNLAGALEHDLSNIVQKFDFEGSSEELKERFYKIEIDLGNYKKLTKNKKKLAKLTKEVKILKDEILKRRGNIWL